MLCIFHMYNTHCQFLFACDVESWCYNRCKRRWWYGVTRNERLPSELVTGSLNEIRYPEWYFMPNGGVPFFVLNVWHWEALRTVKLHLLLIRNNPWKINQNFLGKYTERKFRLIHGVFDPKFSLGHVITIDYHWWLLMMSVCRHSLWHLTLDFMVRSELLPRSKFVTIIGGIVSFGIMLL